MTETNYIYEETSGVPLKMWARGVAIEEEAKRQLHNTASLPFIHKHVAVMPDAHWGMGSTIGSVIPTKGAIIPAAVGVDLGCGMTAVQTNLKAEDLPDNLEFTRSCIEEVVPHGRTNNGGANDRGAWGNIPNDIANLFNQSLENDYEKITEKHPKAFSNNNARHLGTLGTGNHFIEICLDENNSVWAMLHSGSRGCGNRIGTYFISKAKKEMERWFISLPDMNLSYLVEGSELFDDYVKAVKWAQHFAKENRRVMMERVLLALAKSLNNKNTNVTQAVVDCHHNYVEKENHFGSNVWVTRKGAVRARKNDLGIIPGSMGVQSYIVRGKGNSNSFHSCSHGAGRAMSRNEAKRRFTVNDHIEATRGVECRKDESVLDETPNAYKNIDDVMNAQKDLVEIVHTLKQVVCVKG